MELLETITKQRLLLVTGKGGAGKSVLAVALARSLANAGKKVHLVELGRRRDYAFSRLHELLATARLEHELQPIPIAGTGELWAARLDPGLCLAEYIALKLPGGSFAGLLLKNKVTASLLEIVPGMLEIVTLGKLWHSLQERSKNTPDIIIIDGPASGHAATLLQSPANFSRLTKVGPLYRDANEMRNFLQDPKQSGVLFVSIPELMSLEEAKEFSAIFGQSAKSVTVCINKLWTPGAAAQGVPAWAKPALHYRQLRAQRENAALKEFSKLKIQLQAPFFFVPQAELISTFADWLQESVDER